MKTTIQIKVNCKKQTCQLTRQGAGKTGQGCNVGPPLPFSGRHPAANAGRLPPHRLVHQPAQQPPARVQQNWAACCAALLPERRQAGGAACCRTSRAPGITPTGHSSLSYSPLATDSSPPAQPQLARQAACFLIRCDGQGAQVACTECNIGIQLSYLTYNSTRGGTALDWESAVACSCFAQLTTHSHRPPASLL